MHDIALVSGLCVFCCDPRDDLWKEGKEHLIPKRERFAPIGILGGPICLANPDSLPTEFHFLVAQLHFAFATFPRMTKIIVIGHDCGYYKNIKDRVFSLDDKKQDLVKAAEFLAQEFPHLAVTAFFKNTDAPGFTKML